MRALDHEGPEEMIVDETVCPSCGLVYEELRGKRAPHAGQCPRCSYREPLPVVNTRADIAGDIEDEGTDH